MKKIEKRMFRRLGDALLFGGVFAAGAALGTFSLVSPPAEVEAGPHNFVRSVSKTGPADTRRDK